MSIQLFLLAFGAHPDDVELSCAGTLVKHTRMGLACGIVDLTRGELGTRGTPEQRDAEATAAAALLGVQVRENLQMRDGFFQNDEEHQLKIIRVLRTYQPEIILCNAVDDRHPDHAKAAQLVRDAAFLSGLRKVETRDAHGNPQEAHRPRRVLHYIQDKDLTPHLLVDITEFFPTKWKSIQAYKSQFHDEQSKEPQTYISTPEFLDGLKGRHLLWGKRIGVRYAEGFTMETPPGLSDLKELL
ncbi:MAG TPA: bacillithiol biosynthesis deacetylase BshB1 [Chitinophagales bacterium]|nr:bacillithiol biosynthesis deacetylase BshB1 [Chitinophagales bacterium]